MSDDPWHEEALKSKEIEYIRLATESHGYMWNDPLWLERREGMKLLNLQALQELRSIVESEPSGQVAVTRIVAAIADAKRKR
jgi:hypothetical protein